MEIIFKLYNNIKYIYFYKRKYDVLLKKHIDKFEKKITYH